MTFLNSWSPARVQVLKSMNLWKTLPIQTVFNGKSMSIMQPKYLAFTEQLVYTTKYLFIY